MSKCGIVNTQHPPKPAIDESQRMIETSATIVNKLGLHARAAAKFVATASAFGCTIKIGFNNKVVDGKSIMSVMMLAAGIGSDVQLSFDGDDEERAQEAVLALIANRFGEEE
jgi:phosphocarrier protein HPr